ncbi:hypothetical protein [Agriterribacter sp.]|uniref:Crp/Fnr family transcriptional regulator n=1 Tax=Agriterribacter sp. TaxID=2821509 RepID=UPI002B7DAA20|nr:hypothetical protein [Agriterribacter sp.]HTN07617.1 hypothetical protein [Agriterribacter sp.]
MNKSITNRTTSQGAKTDHSPLVDFMRAIYPLGKKAGQYIIQNSFRKKIIKGKYLLKPGEFCAHYYYIHKGVLRAFIKEGKKEITTWINPENEITTSIRSMSRREPSLEYIQVMENSDLYVMSFESLQKMYALFPEMNIVVRILLEEYYAASEERSYISRLPSAEKRYRHFIASRPELVNRIPLKYVASYLGMSEETLSRLRGKKSM